MSPIHAAVPRVQAGPEQAELIAFRVSQDVPLLLACLADVSQPRAKL
jgi:hypothetical protein